MDTSKIKSQLATQLGKLIQKLEKVPSKDSITANSVTEPFSKFTNKKPVEIIKSENKETFSNTNNGFGFTQIMVSCGLIILLLCLIIFFVNKN